MAKTKIEIALDAINARKGLKYPDVGYRYYADVRGDGSNRKSVYVIINDKGGVAYDAQLNGRNKMQTSMLCQEAALNM